MAYSEHEIERIVRVGFELARSRQKKLISVDKANVLESSRLWRQVAVEVAESYPDVALEHMLVDACSMRLIQNPRYFDVLVTDIKLPDVSGLEILELAREMNPDAAVIMMTGYASMETAVDAVNRGAYAYFIKPVNPDEIKTTIANALKQQRLSLENKRLVESLQRSNKLLFKANEDLTTMFCTI